MNVLSLFDGISCGRIALERAGIKVDNYFASEIDKNAIEVSKDNYKDIIRLGDVREWRKWDLPKIDLIIGGSPCQGFSRNGKMLNFDDPRSMLFFEYVEILEKIKKENPEVLFLLENVEMKKEWRDIITEFLGVEPVLINSKVCTAQNRTRNYWTNIPNYDIKEKDVKIIDILEEVNTEEYINNNGLKFDPRITEKGRELVYIENGEIRVKQAVKKGYAVAQNGDGVNLSFPTSKTRRGRVIKGKSSTLDCQCETCVLVDGTVRMFTRREKERLQTLPDGYTKCVNEAAANKAIGNCWTVEVIKQIFEGIKTVSESDTERR